MSFIGILSSTSTLWNVRITPHSISIFFHKSPNKLIKIKEPATWKTIEIQSPELIDYTITRFKFKKTF